jgi:integrase
MRANTVNESTLGCDRSIYHVYMLPHFGGKLIRDCLSQESIDDWYNAIIGDPKLSQNKKSKAVARMKDLLKFAYQRKYIDAVTYQDCDVALYPVKSAKSAKTERVVWSLAEEAAFMSAITDKRDYVMFATFLACGARLGEFLALQPKCFDRESGKIVICQQAMTLPGKGTFVTGKLKTHDSYRKVKIDEKTAVLLGNYIDALGIKDDEFLFFEHDRKSPMGRSTFRRRLYKYCDLAGVRRINPHASRHIQATRLASVCVTGQEIEAAARRLGHSPEMFLNTYARHADDATETALINRLPKA